MSLEDLKHAVSGNLPTKIFVTVLTAGISGGGGWLVSTTVNDHSAISALTEDVHNLVGAVRDSKGSADSAIGRIVNIQEQQDREISRLEQAMRDSLKADFPPH